MQPDQEQRKTDNDRKYPCRIDSGHLVVSRSSLYFGGPLRFSVHLDIQRRIAFPGRFWAPREQPSSMTRRSLTKNAPCHPRKRAGFGKWGDIPIAVCTSVVDLHLQMGVFLLCLLLSGSLIHSRA